MPIIDALYCNNCKHEWSAILTIDEIDGKAKHHKCPKCGSEKVAYVPIIIGAD